jgi:hypothetical protein
MASETTHIDELKKRIAKREEFLRIILNFAQTVVKKYGRETKREELSDHMNIDTELRGFNEFDVLWSQGRSNSIEIFYSPAPAERNRSRVFSMNYWHTGIEGCEIILFSVISNWQIKFIYTAEHVDEIIAKIDAERTQAQKAHADARRKKDEEERILARAKRLLIE